MFAGTRQLPASWSAALQLLSFPCSSCGRVCFVLSCVLTLLFPSGSPALHLAEPSQPVAKGNPLGSWPSPLPWGHAVGSGLEPNRSPGLCWVEGEPCGGPAMLAPNKISFSPTQSRCRVCMHSRKELLPSCSGLLARCLLQPCFAVQHSTSPTPARSHRYLSPV